jgi:hypothetical protein
VRVCALGWGCVGGGGGHNQLAGEDLLKDSQ